MANVTNTQRIEALSLLQAESAGSEWRGAFMPYACSPITTSSDNHLGTKGGPINT
jgi:hypothetical protein|tara:strand:- start:266980 stop:267144 length:165 start_codon:yes stop_codon:yes gene_type:complete